MSLSSSQTFLRELDKKLWTAADKLRSNLDAAVDKHAVLGLIFLKYVSDSFAQRQAEIEAMLKDPENEFFVDPASYDKPAQ
jgi:type I restriction enzyme M protein